jgi:transcriptional regulator
MRIVTHDELLKRRPITPADCERIDEIKRAMEFQVALHELREQRGITQTAVAEQLGTSRPNVSRIEAEDDVRFTTLDRYIRALGGHLEVRVVFDDGESVELVR